MRARVRKFVAVVATGLLPLPASPGNAEIVNKLSTIDGIRLEYKVVLPRNYDPQKAYPAVLAFPPGGQDMDMSMRLSPAITARRPNSAATSW